MADRSRGDGWWQASDGKWYPLELMDSPLPEWPTVEQQPVLTVPDDKTVPEALALVASGAVLVAAAAQASVALAGLNLVSAMASTAGPLFLDGVPVNKAEYGLWALSTFFALLALGVSAVIVMVWLFRSSKALDARGTFGRTWSSGWTVGSWFIPLANLVLPRLVIGEMEKIAQVPNTGEAVGLGWKRYRRLAVGDLWWLLWVGGNLVATFGELGRVFGVEDDGRRTTLLAVTSLGYMLTAAGGVALFVLIRTITRAAND